MRIANAARFDAVIDNLQRRQRDLAAAQLSMTDGKRIHDTSDDPSGAARAERARVSQKRLEAEQRSLDASRNAMQLAESTLGQATELLQQARETLVSAGNGSYSSAERQALMQHLKGLRAQLLGLANRSDGAGGHVFGAQSGAVQPFLDAPAGVQSVSSPGAMGISNQAQMPTTLDGPRLWLQAPTGNGVYETGPDAANTGQGWVSPGTVTDPAAITGDAYEVVLGGAPGALTYDLLRNGAPVASGVAYRAGAAIGADGMSFAISGQPAVGDRFTVQPSAPTMNIFSALDRTVAALADAAAGGGQVAQAVTFGLRDVDASLGHLLAGRAAAGAAMQRMDGIEQRNADRKLWAQTVQSQTEDGDMVQMISEFQNQQSGYQAALQSYAMVQRLSLLDFLK